LYLASKIGLPAEKGSLGQVVDRMPTNPGKIGSNRRFDNVFLDFGNIKVPTWKRKAIP
jgi:hypothetical protein